MSSRSTGEREAASRRGDTTSRHPGSLDDDGELLRPLLERRGPRPAGHRDRGAAVRLAQLDRDVGQPEALRGGVHHGGEQLLGVGGGLEPHPEAVQDDLGVATGAEQPRGDDP